MNEFLPTRPFDLYTLHLFHLVAKHSSFTKAGQSCGITQSAITRQIQMMERQLGVPLFKRTTRTVTLTPAGRFLVEQSSRLVGDLDASLQHLRENFLNAPRPIRIGISQTISLSYLPGFLFANLRKNNRIQPQVSQNSSQSLIRDLESNRMDLIILCPPSKLPTNFQVAHEFSDTFTLISSKASPLPLKRSIPKWIQSQSWIGLQDNSYTSQQLQRWMQKQGFKVTPTLQVDNFDLIINLVLLGMGISLVPQRALSLYSRKEKIQRIPTSQRFSRKIVVLCRKQRPPSEMIQNFVNNILF